MQDLLVLIGVIAYSYFAIRWGFRFVNGRWALLEQPKMKPVKVIIAILLGYICVGFYFILWCLKTISRIWN